MNSKFNSELTALCLFHEYSEWNRNCATLRFGQYIINKYLSPDETAPEIFYEENARLAFDMIIKEL